MPIGYLLAVALASACTLLAISPCRRPRLLAAVSFRLGLAVNELPFVAFYWLLAATLWAASIETRLAARLRDRLPLARILVMPLPVHPVGGRAPS